MLSVNTNLSSLIVRNNLNQSTNALNRAIERMTTGFKINGAKDNAANYGISNGMSSQISSYEVAEENAMMGLDMIETASASLDLINNRISRLRTLQEQALNDTYGEASLNAINAEVNCLIDEIERLYLNTEYNGINLFLETTKDENNTFQILQEVYAQETTTLKELGIGDSEFGIYDKENNLLETVNISTSETISDIFAALKKHGFITKISSGVISISSKDGLYISGNLADSLGISLKKSEYITSTSQTSSAPVNYETVTTNVTEEMVYTTTTVQTTQISTIETTTTTPIEQTQTITTFGTAGTTQTSTGKLTYEKVTKQTFSTLIPDYSSPINITITSLAAITTWAITPTTCATLRDVENLINRQIQSGNLKSFSYWTTNYPTEQIGYKVYEDWSYSRELYFFTSDGQKLRLLNINADLKTETVISTTTANATGSTTMSNLSLSTKQYITVCNDKTFATITCTSTTTLNSLKNSLASNGITMNISGGKVTISGTNTAYIKGMSSSLASALKLDNNDYYTVGNITTITTNTIYETTTTTTTQTATIEETKTTVDVKTVTTLVTATLSATTVTNFADLGVKSSFNVTVHSDGTKSVIKVNKDKSIKDLLNEINAFGIDASLSDGKISFLGNGNSYVDSQVLNLIFNLGSLDKAAEFVNVNTKSNSLKYAINILDELGSSIYAPGSVALQVGIYSDEASQIIVATSFSLIGYSDLRSIGTGKGDYLDLIDEMLASVSMKQTELGAAQNRVISALEEINTHYENLVSSRSTLRDADVVVESSEYMRNQILQQASSTLLATANQAPAFALQLL